MEEMVDVLNSDGIPTGEIISKKMHIKMVCGIELLMFGL
jgi:hypothetical protein